MEKISLMALMLTAVWCQLVRGAPLNETTIADGLNFNATDFSVVDLSTLVATSEPKVTTSSDNSVADASPSASSISDATEKVDLRYSEELVKDEGEVSEVDGGKDKVESVTTDASDKDAAKVSTVSDVASTQFEGVTDDVSVKDDLRTLETKEKADVAIDKTELGMKYVPPLDPMNNFAPKAPESDENEAKKSNLSEVSTTTVASTTIDKDQLNKEIVEEKVIEVTDNPITVEIKTETASGATTKGDVGDNPSTTSLFKSEEIFKDVPLDEEVVETEKSETTQIDEGTVATTLKPQEISKETLSTTTKSGSTSPSVLLKSAELQAAPEDSTTTTSETSDVSESSSATSVSTTNADSETESTSKKENLLKNSDLVTSEIAITTASDDAMTTEGATEGVATEIKLSSIADVSLPSEFRDKVDDVDKETSVLTTRSQEKTTVVEESTTTVAIEKEEEKPLIEISDDDVEFRAAKIPLNISKVAYTEKVEEPVEDQKDSLNENQDDDIDVEESETTAEEESTTSKILTTIQELLLSLTSITTTEPPVDDSPSTETAIPSKPTESKKTVGFLIDDSEVSETKIQTGTEVESQPGELLKAQAIKTVVAPVVSELGESTDVQPMPTTEDSQRDVPSTRSAPVTVEDIETTSAPLKEDTTTTEESITASEPSSTFDPESVKESGDTPETATDPELLQGPSDYGVNIKNRYVSGNNTDTVAAVQFLHQHDKTSSEQCFKLVDAHWNYATDLTEENKKNQLAQTLEYSLFHKEAWKNATSYAWKSFNDTLLRRWFKSLSVLGTAALPEDKLNEFNKLKAEMKNTYSTAKVCPYQSQKPVKKGQQGQEKDCNLTLEPDLQRILTKSRDYDELTHVWKAWRDSAGKPIREKYLTFVALSNEAARMNGFPDTGDMWREAYESDTFQDDLETLWQQVRPLYEHLHAYVRRKLIGQYGSDKIKEDGPIPAHLFGNMWAQSWVSLLDITQPFSGKPSVDVTSVMEAKNMSALEMFKISEEFFTSLGLKEMPEEFWKHSLIEKPKDREIICHASAWDFCNGKDYRIKQCTDITMEDLITVHHEMGHIQYFLQYARQPNVFREGANPGFHEAIGDVLALSVSTPKHLQSIGLLTEIADDPEGDLNFLLRTALDKVSFLPSGYLIDLWRWGLFSGEIKPEEMNSKWWELRLKYQGICPPVKRTDTDFDPGAKYHVPGNVPYIRSKEAGQILSQVMELGSSEHWSEAMKIMTGGATNKMDASPILEYFEPLLDFLQNQNKNETLGWHSEDATICP